MLGLTGEHILILVAVGVGLLVLLFGLRWIFSLARTFLRLGCIGIVIILIIVFVLMGGMGG